jgi:hypothetical protein
MIDGSFDSTETVLHDLLVEAGSGKLQFAGSQRGSVLDDERIGALFERVRVSGVLSKVYDERREVRNAEEAAS